MKMNPIRKLAPFVLLLAFIGCRVGKLPVTSENAELLYVKYHYIEAAYMFEKLLGKESDQKVIIDYTNKLANCYYQTDNYVQALKWYSKASALQPGKPDLIYKHAMMLKSNELYAEAIAKIEEYKKLVPGDKRIADELALCNMALELKATGSNYSIDNLTEINTRYNEYSAYLTNDGIYFTSDRSESTGEAVFGWTGLYFSDIFFSPLEEDGYRSPKIMAAEINTERNEGIASFNSDGNTMVFTQCNGKGYDSTCALMLIKRERGTWGQAQAIPFSVDGKYFYGQGSLSPNGKTLVFVTNIPTGFGGNDIFITHFNDKKGVWDRPENLGNKINTSGDEMFPYMPDDQTIYFSSNGHPGFGGLDIFKAVKINGTWRKPVNLLIPMNSGGDDFGVCFDPKDALQSSGIITSNRKGSEGDDIYTFKKVVPPLCTVSGTVFDNKTKQPIPNSLVYLSEVGTDNSVYIKTDEKGSYSMKLFYDKEYSMEAYTRYYTFNQSKPRLSTFNLNYTKTFKQDFYLDKWTIDEIKIEGIRYDVGSADIRADAIPILDSLTSILKLHDYLIIELASHTDCRASMDYNQDLSQRRAESVVNYLVSKGIASARLQPKGYGETKLLNDCGCEGTEGKGLNCTEEQHQVNRRTTFRILRTDFKGAGSEPIGTLYVEPIEE